MLGQALGYFTTEAVGKTELYYLKLQSLHQTKEEVHGTELKKIIRKAEQTRWSLVKSSQQQLSVNDLEFVSFNSKFNEFKRSVASSVRVSYPFAEDQLRCRYWNHCYRMPAHDLNEAIFPCLKFKLLQLATAVKPEKMFIETLVTSDPSTFREQVYAVKEGFDTTSDKDRCAADLNMWETFNKVTSLSNIEENFYINFWIRSDRLAFDTALDEERVARGLNAWEMFDKDTGLSETEVTFYNNFWIRSDRLAFDTALDEERVARGLNAWEMFDKDTGLSETEVTFYNNFWIRSDRLAFDTALDEERVARGLNAWEMFDEDTGLSETEVNFYNNFWIRSDRLAFDTALDEERAARGLNEWEMFDEGIIKNDVCTELQEDVRASRSARGPLSAKLVSKRISRLTEYFSKHKFVQGSIVAPSAIFFAERIEVQTASDVVANFKKHQELESAFFETLVAKGATLTETFSPQKQFKFKSKKAKMQVDERMAFRAQVRAYDLLRLKAYLKSHDFIPNRFFFPALDKHD